MSLSNNSHDSNTSNNPEGAETTAQLMRTDEALNIIQKILQGINPLSDEPLENNSLLLNSDLQRALQTATHALEVRIKWEQRQAQLPTNAGKAWSAHEDEALATAFDNGEDIAALVKKHQRTKGSITARLEKLGKLTR